MTTTALVLGGGGVTGIAWMTGLLLGLQEQGHDFSTAERVIGTSAGAAVAAQLRSGLPLAELQTRQVEPALQVDELVPRLQPLALLWAALPALLWLRRPLRFRRAIGRMALRARTVEPAARRAVIAARLPSADWPALPLTLVAVAARSGEAHCFDGASGVPLVDAVAASCAVPGVWPPVRIDGEPYIDGGMRSSDNADLAAGCRRVLVISPMGLRGLGMPGGRLADQVAALRAAGAQVAVLEPDAASREAMGRNPLDPRQRAPAAEAGRAQGRRTPLAFTA